MRRLVRRSPRQIEADSIGVLGYSLGGETSLATVTGISGQGLPADRRVKAAFMGAGSNYGGVLTGCRLRQRPRAPHVLRERYRHRL